MHRYIQFIMGLLIAGARATGTTGNHLLRLSYYMLGIYLHPQRPG